MITPRRLVTGERRHEDAAEAPLRPQRLDEFIGQAQARANLEVFIAAAGGAWLFAWWALWLFSMALVGLTVLNHAGLDHAINFRETADTLRYPWGLIPIDINGGVKCFERYRTFGDGIRFGDKMSKQKERGCKDQQESTSAPDDNFGKS